MIHITYWGDSGPRVVMVHGSAQGSSVGGDRHFPVQKVLADHGWQLVIPDRPGHGRSPAPGRPDDAEADGAWVADLLEDGAHLVGHSFGGCVALVAASRRLSAVRSLTLVEPGMQPLAMSDPRVRKFALQMLKARLFSLSATRRAKRMMTLLSIPEAVQGGRSAEELKRIGQGLGRLKLPSKSMLETALSDVKRAGIPLLVVTGGWSPAFEATGDIVAAAGGGQRITIPAGHHFPQLNADAFNPVLEAFMKQSETRT